MNEIQELLTADLSPAQQSILRNTTLDENSPGPLLKDIARLIDVIGSGVKTTSAYFALPQRLLVDLNESLVDPLQHDLKRPQLRSFPTLMGLFMLLRSTGLAVGETKPKRAVLIDPEMMEQWLSLNPTERYFALLTSWLYETSWDSVGLRGCGFGGMLGEIRESYMLCISRTSHDTRFGMMYGIESSVAVNLLHQFGWIRLTHGANPKSGKAADVRKVERTDFGDAMFVATCQLQSRDESDPKALQTRLKYYFPDWKHSLEQPSLEYREEDHTFKVSLGKIWRRIVAPADVDLEQLADAILVAYQFDRDHLYQFELRDAKGGAMKIVGPHMDDAEYFADEMQVGDLPLLTGDTMVFHYDFGDDWRFKVTLESVDEIDTEKAKEIKVTEKSGEAPKQYTHYDW